MKLSDINRGWEYPDDFPPQEFWIDPKLEKNNVDKFHELVQRSSGEREIDTFLKENTHILATLMNFTQFGHHGTWVIPQQQIRPPQSVKQKGMKPDYIVGVKGSDGYRWFVVELKGADQNIFTEKNGNIVFSNIVNNGICQLLGYIDYCSSAQAYLRDSLNLNGFREPNGFLIVGRERELLDDPRKQDMKAAWNRITSNRLQIRTYDAFLRSHNGTWAAKQG